MPDPHLSAIPQDDAAETSVAVPPPLFSPIPSDLPPGLPIHDVDPGDMSGSGIE